MSPPGPAVNPPTPSGCRSVSPVSWRAAAAGLASQRRELVRHHGPVLGVIGAGGGLGGLAFAYLVAALLAVLIGVRATRAITRGRGGA